MRGFAGFAASFGVPPAPAPSPELRLSRNPVTATAAILRQAWEIRAVKLSILGSSWFWLVGAVFLSQIPAFAKETLGAGTGVVTLFLAAFSVGIGAGSVLCGKLMHGEISARYVPLAATGMALFSFDLAFASMAAVPPAGGELLGVVAFLSDFTGLRIFVDLTLIAICGGLFIVPLYAIIQHRSDEAARARTIAALNIMNALFMTAAAAVTALLLSSGLSTPHLWLILAILNAAVALWICRLLPQDVLRLLARIVLRPLYRVELHGIEHLAAAGERVVIVPNHVSYLDGPLIAAFLPGYPMFAIDTGQAAKWWVRPLLAGADIYAMDPLRPMATKSLIRSLREGRQCVIFPEGRLNTTGGALMKIYDGPALVADKGDAPVLPVRIDGVEFTPFSRLARHGGRLRRHWFPKVTVTLYPPRRLAIPAELRGRARRHRAGLALYDVMSDMMARRPDPPSLFGAVLASRAAHGGRHPIMADPTGGPLTYNRVIATSLVLGRRLARRTERGEAVGIMLPNSIAAGVAFLALQAIGRVPAMLNHTAGVDAVLSACRTAGLRLVITSRRFVELAKLDALAAALAQTVEIVWLEDLRATLGIARQALWDGRAAYRRLAAPPLRRRRLRAGRNPVHLGVGRRAERGRAEPRQPARQPAPARGAHRLQPGRPSAQSAADVPQLRADRRVSAAALVRRQGVSVPVAAALSDHPRAGLRSRRDNSVRHGHVPRPAMRAPPTLMIFTRCAMSSPGPSRCARRPAASGPSGSASASSKAMALPNARRSSPSTRRCISRRARSAACCR